MARVATSSWVVHPPLHRPSLWQVAEFARWVDYQVPAINRDVQDAREHAQGSDRDAARPAGRKVRHPPLKAKSPAHRAFFGGDGGI